MITAQKTGFARHQVHALAFQSGLDMHAAFMGNEISDKLVVSLAEQGDKLKGTKLNGAKEVLIVTDASSVFVWPARVSGDVYSRNVGACDLRGSLSTLRNVYGANNVHVTDEKGAKKLLATKKAHKATLAFYGLSRLAKGDDAKAGKSEKKKATVTKIGAKKVDGAKK